MSGERPWEVKGGQGTTASEDLDALIQSLHTETGLSRLTLRVCVQRGLVSREAIETFLSPTFEKLTHPSRIQDMEKAVERVARARLEKQKVRIFGDYDVDGTTGAALLFWTFREHGLDFDAVQPDRFRDGYGLNVKAVEEAAAAGVHLLMTVDCGITSHEPALRAQELGVDLVILDHHQLDPNKGIPKAVAVVNPQRPDCASGLKQVCGCGLAFYFAIALRTKGRELGWYAPGREPNLKQHLDLVVMATAADMVPLTGDNHILVRYGLEVLKRSQKAGIQALLSVAGLASKDLSPSHLGFVLGPRINASGRMHSASLALEMLTTLDGARAQELATQLERLNTERANLQNQIWDQVRARIEKGIAEGKYSHGIAIADEGWHEGVIGIVASRVTENFRKPAAVISIREGLGKGSVRSFAGKDVLAALRANAHLLKGFGGHRHAAGFSLAPELIEEFAEGFNSALENIPIESKGGTLLIEGNCSLDELDVRSLQEIEKLGPFGPGNPEPVFAMRARVQGYRVVKGRHLRLDLTSDASQMQSGLHRRGKSVLEAIWFHAAEKPEVMQAVGLSEEQEWAGVPEVNRFRGQLTPTLRVRDWRKIQTVNL
ncbi:MAG: single-stranded-DNA-specific exonuclease RecJ [Bdellovibrio sp.]|nr:single-stranded-DNA-specific exonuclease RecJ [Bdellovibrio sp.]